MFVDREAGIPEDKDMSMEYTMISDDITPQEATYITTEETDDTSKQ